MRTLFKVAVVVALIAAILIAVEFVMEKLETI
jgi:hypothetical protein